MAFYANAGEMKEVLSSGGEINSSGFDKAMCLQLVRDVDSKTFWEALDTSVRPRIAEVATNAATKENDDGDFMSDVAEAAEAAEEKAQEVLKALGEFFLNQGKLTSGTQILIRSPNSQTIQVSSGSSKIEEDSPELVEAIFNVWLDSTAIEPEAKAAFVNGANSL
eukprot:CAMPEP_0196589904 /NCGR_PEP_ID=MMETSP1081-20130531/64980_1 /TAXON_ID=36882 /ORGANISM="Pyramimonas amylifera, Strain CCMP720" /LENGTH=164 /DNA_ID=CAMNT_0041912841 /DNA_START=363 /DNA_END=857 /DNA_ORIENTATION=+